MFPPTSGIELSKFFHTAAGICIARLAGMDKKTLFSEGFRFNAEKFAGSFLPGLLLAAFWLIQSACFAQSSGRVIVTGIPSNMRISGAGYFIVGDPESNEYYFTRQGQFSVDLGGNFVTPTGERLQCADPLLPGFVYDLNIRRRYWTTAEVERFWITPDGQAWSRCADGSQGIVGQILLEKFSNPESLGPWFGGLWTWATNGSIAMSMPGTNGLGIIVPEEIELPLPRLQLTSAKEPSGGVGGSIADTGIATDLMPTGNGFFVLRDTNSDALYATRAGIFFMDTNGYLINHAHMRVQGYNVEGGTAIGDIQILSSYEHQFSGVVPTQYFNIDRSGRVTVSLLNGEWHTIGRVLLATCPHPESLVFTNFSSARIDMNAQLWAMWLAPGGLFQEPLLPGVVALKSVDNAIVSVRQHFNFLRQGVIRFTTNTTDLAISAPTHCFIVRDPAANISYATRVGAFHLDTQSWLVNSNGFRVQGYADAALTCLGDLRVDTNGAATAAPIEQISIQSDGKISVMLANGETFVRGQVLLQRIPCPHELVSAGGDLYTNVTVASASSPLAAAYVSPILISQALETPDFGPSPLSLPPTNGLRIFATQLAGSGTLQSSGDLKNWTDVKLLGGNIAQEAEYFETNPVSGKKFYRIKMNP